jgi:S-adenosylmethionine synthetase
MATTIIESGRRSGVTGVEIMEIKGRGHPDTLSDALAERLSSEYACHTQERFGKILHHNFDKVGLLGGRSHVAFGHGRMTAPVRVLLNGRACSRVGNSSLDLEGILETACRDFLAKELPKLNVNRDIVVLNNLSTSSSPGYVDTGPKDVERKDWFEPRSLKEIQGHHQLTANDTSAGFGYAPLSPCERFLIALERDLTSEERTCKTPWQGTDIKAMAIRKGKDLNLTICVPQIADYVPSLQAYIENLDLVRSEILKKAKEAFPDVAVSLDINARDNFTIPELYLTATGSSIESGDEGLVGRGNRVNGLISMCRPVSMEGAAGKNPVYHVGKLYNVAALRIAEKLHQRTGDAIQVWLISQTGRPLADPWQVVVHTSGYLSSPDVEEILNDVMNDLSQLTVGIIGRKIRVY